LFVIFFAATGHAALVDWTIDISINDDKTTSWLVRLLYNEPVEKSDYFVLTDITRYEVYADGVPISCTLTRGPGTLITCNDIAARNITYSFSTSQLAVDVLQSYRLFTYKLPVTHATEHYKVTVKLPLGSALADEASLKGTLLKPFEPESGKQGSDGRRIFVEWDLDKPTLGETLDVAIVFEQFSEPLQLTLFVVIVIAVAAALLVLVKFMYKRPQDILPILTENERKIIQILIREKGQVDQRVLVKETDFSKAKVSRLVKDLSNRGLIEKVSKGRKNLIMLKKPVKAEKIAKPEGIEKSEKK